MVKLHEEIRLLRKKAGLTQEQFSLRLGISRERLIAIESNPDKLSVVMADKIARALDKRLVVVFIDKD